MHRIGWNTFECIIYISKQQDHHENENSEKNFIVVAIIEYHNNGTKLSANANGAKGNH